SSPFSTGPGIGGTSRRWRKRLRATSRRRRRRWPHSSARTTLLTAGSRRSASPARPICLPSGIQRDGVVADDAAVWVPVALYLGEARADVGGEDFVGVAGALGEVEVAAVAGPGVHDVVEAVEMALDRFSQLRGHRHPD